MARVTQLTVLAGKLKSTLVLSLRHVQSLNDPMSIRVRFVAASYVSPGEALGNLASIYVQVGNQPVHHTRGAVTSITLIGTPQLEGSNRISPTYEITIESVLAPLRGTVDSRIFQEQTTKDIVTSVLGESAIPADYLDFRCRQTPFEHRYAIRYQEDALSFASRMLEDDGTYFFESTGGEEQKLVFDDTSTAATERLEGPLHLREAAGFDGDEPSVFSVERRVAIRPGAVALAAYSFKKALRLESTATRDENTEPDHYSFS